MWRGKLESAEILAGRCYYFYVNKKRNCEKWINYRQILLIILLEKMYSKTDKALKENTEKYGIRIGKY